MSARIVVSADQREGRSRSGETVPVSFDQSAPTTADRIVAGLAPSLARPARSNETPSPIPVVELHALPRDGSIVYGMGRIDPSGRIVDRDVLAALAWVPGQRLTLNVATDAIVIHPADNGLLVVPAKPCIVIPAPARARCAINPGDRLLLSAIPQHALLIVHTLRALDAMMTDYLAHGEPT